jgi:hypothetical protein
MSCARGRPPVGGPPAAGRELPRLGFVLITHRHGGQVELLTRRLLEECPDSLIAIHHDPRQPALPATLREMPGVLLVPDPVHVDWGSWSQVTAMVLGYRRLLEADGGPDWFVLLSGDDLPIRPLSELRELFRDTQVSGFVLAEPLDGSSRPDLTDRYHFQWRRLPSWIPLRWLPRRVVQWSGRRQRWWRFQTRTNSGDWIGRRRDHPFDGRTMLFKASQWCDLSRAAVRIAVEAYDTSTLSDWFRQTLIPDEAWLPTVLGNDARLRLEQRTLHYVVFDPPESPHPRTFGDTDLPELRASGMFFARKFDLAKTPDLVPVLLGSSSTPETSVGGGQSASAPEPSGAAPRAEERSR